MNTEGILMKQYRENLDFLIGLKNFIGNIDNRIHDSAMVLVSDYLKAKHPKIKNDDWNFKMGSQIGTDIEGIVDGGQKVIGELKTTKPYGLTDFGAKQKEMILKDLERLESANVKNKYFFVIDSDSFNILKDKYQKKFPNVKIVNILKPEKGDSITPKDTLMGNGGDVEIKLTEGPIKGYFFNIPKKYQHLIQEGNIEIINDLGETMYCNTVPSMGKCRIAKNLNNWYKMKMFQPGDRFYLKKFGDKKFKVVSVKRAKRR